MRKRVAVHVAPRLLSEGLLLELGRRSVDLTPIHMPRNHVAVVSEIDGVEASVIIEVVAEDSVRIHHGDESENRRCRSVDDLVALIEEFAT